MKSLFNFVPFSSFALAVGIIFTGLQLVLTDWSVSSDSLRIMSMAPDFADGAVYIAVLTAISVLVSNVASKKT